MARDTAGNITAVSIDRPLKQFMRKKGLKRDLKGLIQGTAQTDPIIRELTNTVTAFTDAHIATDAANEAQKEDALVDKTIESMFPGSKITNLGNLVQVPPGEDVENSSPQLYFKLANKKQGEIRLAIPTLRL